ncbi:hypothetical protein [Chitinophaga sp. LS1]|uniref:hypothetical protein n=1 Tax=Chitinophaga sp. LS1 TaxID=3051176 RepID=UPI002AABEEEE|nr:hypothetical protein [Chitinophaga sp. LS1]WPV66517.1 hypothetical protein QQL36_32500 [Chitinophaga sp. LS1]
MADITAMLHLHFEEFKTLKPETIRKNINSINQETKEHNKDFSELDAALTNHFFGKR